MPRKQPARNSLSGPVSDFRATAYVRGPWKFLLRDFEMLQPRAATRSFAGKDFDLDLRKTSPTDGLLRLSLTASRRGETPDALLRKLLDRLNAVTPRRRRWRLHYDAELCCEVPAKSAAHRVLIAPDLLATLARNVLRLAFELRSTAGHGHPAAR